MPYLEDFMSGGQQEEPVAPVGSVGEDEDDLDFAETAMRGFFERFNNKQQPTRKDFDSQFRQSISPAREFLANFFLGMSSGMAGQKFTSVRERKYNEWMEKQQLEQRDRAQAAQEMNQLFTNARYIYLQKQNAKSKEYLKELDIAAKDKLAADNRAHQVGLAHLKQKFNMETLEQKESFTNSWNKIKEFLPNDATYQVAMSRVLAEATATDPNFDPTQIMNNPKLMNQVNAEYHKELEYEYNLKNKFGTQRMSIGELLERRAAEHPYTNSYGDLETYTTVPGKGIVAQPMGDLVDPASNKVVGRTKIPIRVLPPAAVERLSKEEEVLGAMRGVIDAVRQHPDDIGKAFQAVSPTVRSFIGQLPSGERNIRVLLNAAVSMRLLAISGVAVSNTERTFLQQGLPKVFEKPENFLPGAVAFHNMIAATVMREKAGISLNDLDMYEVMNSFFDDYVKNPLAYKRIPTPEDFIRLAAKQKNKKVIYDAKGHIRGVE